MSRILLSYIGYPVSAGKFFKKALRQMGHEVIHFGPDAGTRLPWQPGVDFWQYADHPDIKLDYPANQTYPIERALEKCGTVDLVIQMDACFHLTGKAPVPNVVWMIDNHVATYDDSTRDADVLFGAHSWGFHSEDSNFRWLPCAYSPDDHFATGAQKTFDLMFLGVVYQHRHVLLDALAGLGQIGVGMGVLGKEYNDGYNAARMGLCLSAKGDLPMRVFENAAQGLLVFCDQQRDLTKLGLKDGNHYVGFAHHEEAVNKFRHLMENPDEVALIAQNGHAALAKETYTNRAETIFGAL